MALQGNGRLLVKVRDHPFLELFALEPPFKLDGYAARPLSEEQAAPGFDARTPGDHWLIAEPLGPLDFYATPWDHAHAAAEAHGYRHYVEPDILHTRLAARPAAPAHHGGLPGGDADWPPSTEVSPGWHLGPDFAGFEAVRGKATGTGVWIAHLDTGYRPNMCSNPPRLHPELGWDYWLNHPSPIDPGVTGPLEFPGHGAATSALLAGGQVQLPFGAHSFTGELGGAPDADVIPIRISPSVIHLWTASMAQGINLARIRRCDVASISHGGVPSALWADAVNQAYAAGVNIVAASGDNYFLEVIDLATRYTVYPSAFNRVITALGATYDKQAYITTDVGEVQECWGPDPVMAKAVCGYSPNIVWMEYDHPPLGFVMHGQGTSVSTPQVAAACALWLQCYAGRIPGRDWRRAEACRHALFTSADKSVAGYSLSTMGQGVLRAPELLSDALADEAIRKAEATGPSQPDSIDSVLGAIWDLLTGRAPAGADAEEDMYKAETAQILFSSTNQSLRALAHLVPEGAVTPARDRVRYRSMLHTEAISARLRRRLPLA